MLCRGRILTLIVCAILLAGCEPQDDYTTRLTSTHGLRAGDPVIHSGRRIGTVNSVRSTPDGDFEAAFAIQPGYNHEVREDSVVVVSHENGAVVLKLLSTTATASRPVPPGSRIPAIASEAQATIVTSLQTSKPPAANAPEALRDLNATLDKLDQSPAWKEFHIDLQQMQREMSATGAHEREVLARRLPHLRIDLYHLETRLRVEGASAEAERLRIDLDALARSLGASPTPSSDD